MLDNFPCLALHGTKQTCPHRLSAWQKTQPEYVCPSVRLVPKRKEKSLSWKRPPPSPMYTNKVNKSRERTIAGVLLLLKPLPEGMQNSRMEGFHWLTVLSLPCARQCASASLWLAYNIFMTALRDSIVSQWERQKGEGEGERERDLCVPRDLSGKKC